jgi:hypothetical protein
MTRLPSLVLRCRLTRTLLLLSLSSLALLLCDVGRAFSKNTSALSASISVDSSGSIHVAPVPGQDVLLGSISINETVHRIESVARTQGDLSTSIAAAQADSRGVLDTISNLTGELSALEAQLNAIQSQQSNIVCGTPQILASPFESFAFFSPNNGTALLLGEADHQSVLYKSGPRSGQRFVAFQHITTAINTARVSAFTVDSAQYVALPYHFDGFTYESACELFLVEESTGVLLHSQNISTFGVTGVSAVTAPNGSNYLAVSNRFNQAGVVNLPSFVMRFNPATKLFEHFQNLSTSSAHPPEFFMMGSDVFLVIPFWFNASFTIESPIYKLEQTQSFTVFQTIPTDGATHMKPWVRDSLQYLSIANWHGQYIETYVFNQSLNQFVNITSGQHVYFSQNPQGIDVTEIAGDTYMIVACSGTEAGVFRWDVALTRFTQTQQLTISSPGWYYPLFFTKGTDTFLSLADHVYMFCDGVFSLS